MLKLLSSVFLTLMILPTIAFGERASFAPENDLYLEDSLTKDANITEEEFNQITDRFVDLYRPLAELYGATLTAVKNWPNNTVNAYAYQENDGQDWFIAMFGGLARRPEVTKDGYAMVVCHELAHHMGGFPVKNPGYWASAEGQSDYWATQTCARKAWKDEADINASFRDTVDPVAKRKCDEVWDQTAQQDLCYRVSMAGQSLGNLLAVLGRSPEPSFATPDQNVVTRTNMNHPKAQCRLDTYFYGALCKLNHRGNFIPGKHHPQGQLSKAAEHESAGNSCYTVDQYSEGSRPACWFKSTLSPAL